jgi:DNA-binding transcriptional MocR family regulator
MVVRSSLFWYKIEFVQTQYRITGSTASTIAASIEEGVRDGGLKPGAALPPVRKLADDLAVAANTVAAAYRALRQRGVIETDGRRGTRIRPRPPAQSRVDGALPVPTGARDLSDGAPDIRLLPDFGPPLRRLRPTPVSYADAGPYPPLVALGAARLAADGVPTDSLTVTNGALDGIERCLLAHTSPGDRIAVEDPGWNNVLDLLAALGLDPVPVGVDDDGPLPADLRRALRHGARATIVTSRAHNPTGAAVSAARAADLRAVLGDYPDSFVIEDDHAAELAGVPLHTLAGATTNWAVVRSASKPYGPDLRTALLAGDETTVSRVRGRLRLGAGWVSHVLQRLVVELWSDPGVAELVGRAGAAYTERRVGLIDALAVRGIAAHGRTGLNVWIPVPDETTAFAALRDAGWVVAPGARYRLLSRPALRITVSRLDVGQLDEVAEAVAGALRPSVVRRGV